MSSMETEEKDIFDIDPPVRGSVVRATTAGHVSRTLKNPRQNRDYILRDSIHTAKSVHHCIECHTHIFPGDRYENLVMAINGRIIEHKTHYDPGCPEPDDEGWGENETSEECDNKEEEDIAYQQAA